MRKPDTLNRRTLLCLFVFVISMSANKAIAQEIVTAVTTSSNSISLEPSSETESKPIMDVHINPLEATDVISIQIRSSHNSIESIELINRNSSQVLSVNPMSFVNKSDRKDKVYNYSLRLPVGHLPRDLYDLKIKTLDKTYVKSLELVSSEYKN